MNLDILIFLEFFRSIFIISDINYHQINFTYKIIIF
jgi:hypothetical protein